MADQPTVDDLVKPWAAAERLHVSVSPKSAGVAPYEITDREVIRKLAGLIDRQVEIRRLDGRISQGSYARVRIYKNGSDDEPALSVTVTPKRLLFSRDGKIYEVRTRAGGLYGRLVRKNFEFPADERPGKEEA